MSRMNRTYCSLKVLYSYTLELRTKEKLEQPVDCTVEMIGRDINYIVLFCRRYISNPTPSKKSAKFENLTTPRAPIHRYSTIVRLKTERDLILT